MPIVFTSGLQMSGGYEVVAAPSGQQVFLSSGGSTTFVVPSGITTLSSVCIAPGIVGYTNGVTYTQGGYGGALEYHAGFAVTPGETLTISFSGGTARIMRSATVLCGANGQLRSAGAGAVGNPGGNGFYTLTAGPFQGDGGGSGQYGSAGADGAGNNGLNGAGASLLGTSPGGGTLYGGGGADGGTPQIGAIRIMWGPGRAYPATGVANQ
jgi:hypothetical protein